MLTIIDQTSYVNDYLSNYELLMLKIIDQT